MKISVTVSTVRFATHPGYGPDSKPLWKTVLIFYGLTVLLSYIFDSREKQNWRSRFIHLQQSTHTA